MLNILKNLGKVRSQAAEVDKGVAFTGTGLNKIILDPDFMESVRVPGRKLGKARHYPPATKEWVNSTYTYNKNYVKTLPVADNVVNKLIKGYLNMNPLVNNKKSKRVDVRFKRLSLNNILVSKAESKHTNNKIAITVYLYNRNKKFFLYKLKNLYKSFDSRSRVISKTNPIIEVNYLKKKINFVSLRATKLIDKVRKHENFVFETLNWDSSNFTFYRNKYYKNFVKNAYEIELLYMYYIKMITLNNNKFKNWFLLGLKKTISKLYNKKVEFNFVSLKYLHLNSDIFVDSIVTRIRNRENPLLVVLSKALRLAKIPSLDHNLRYNIKNNRDVISFIKHKPIINTLNTPLLKNYANDGLNALLKNIFPENNKDALFLLKAKKLNNKQRSVLDAIKNKSISGVRLEAAGRLSKRLTASRSVFKLRYKGGLKNIDSSRKGISSVILRGNANSNVQYTLVNNKTRNGSFGLKGWVSGN